MMILHRVKQIRKRLNLSQKAFAKKVGVDQARVSQWETDKSLPHCKALIEMALLGMNINWLLTGDGKMIVGVTSSSKNKIIFSEEQKNEIERLIDERLKKN